MCVYVCIGAGAGGRVPKIIYASRTHSQLSHVIKELKSTRYRCGQREAWLEGGVAKPIEKFWFSQWHYRGTVAGTSVGCLVRTSRCTCGCLCDALLLIWWQ